jgi:transposase
VIRSTKTSIKFTNPGKLDKIDWLIDEYKKVVEQTIDLIWDIENIPALIPKNITDQIETWLSARMVQCAAKQASGIVRGTQRKQKKRQFTIDKLKKSGQFKKARKLERIYNNVKVSKPKIKNIQCELDERFVKIEFSDKTSFDGWVTIGSIGNRTKIQIPFKKHSHFNQMLSKGLMKRGIRLSKTEITFIFEIEPVKQENGKTLGIDVGQSTTLSCSDGQLIDKCPHGHNYSSICDKLARKQKNSKNFKKAVRHRTNYLGYIVNNLNLDGVSIVNRENIKNLRKFSNVKRCMKHWNYAELFDELDQKFESQGVLVNKLDPAHTSRRCSQCGWTRKLNRKNKRFKCEKCSFEHDADLNAALNLSFSLNPVTEKQRLQKNGFYWSSVSKEPIVPSVQKTNCYKIQ